jgi:hypothetical protein
MPRAPVAAAGDDGAAAAASRALPPAVARGAQPPCCRFFGGDKRDGPREFFKACIDPMQAECVDDGGEDCAGTGNAP